MSSIRILMLSSPPLSKKEEEEENRYTIHWPLLFTTFHWLSEEKRVTNTKKVKEGNPGNHDVGYICVKAISEWRGLGRVKEIMSHIHHIHPPRQPPTHTYAHAHTRTHKRTHYFVLISEIRQVGRFLKKKKVERTWKKGGVGKIARPSPLMIKV